MSKKLISMTMKPAKTGNSEVIQQCDVFIQNVICRRDANQHKAYIAWIYLEGFLDDNVRNGIADDWLHFEMSHLSIEEFEVELKLLKDWVHERYGE